MQMCYWIIKNYTTGDEREIRCPESELVSVLRDWAMSGYYLLYSYD